MASRGGCWLFMLVLLDFGVCADKPLFTLESISEKIEALLLVPEIWMRQNST
jgi:hypothetical protein